MDRQLATAKEEIEAIGVCIAALYPLDEEAIQWALRYLQDKFRKPSPPPSNFTGLPFVTGSNLPADCR